MPSAPRPRRLSRLAIAWLVLLATMGSAHAQAQQRATNPNAIDLVMLVDVSQSMFKFATNRGNDRERIRWDAVLLALDLLTEDDRVAIIPFNEHVPAHFGADAVPGKLPDGFFVTRSATGRAVQDKIRKFVHSEETRASEPGDRNGDFGQTAILMALDKAKDALAAQPDPARNRYVILLTDGNETKISEKPLRLRRLATDNLPVEGQDLKNLESNLDVKKWLAAYNSPFPPEAPVRLYTMGLGTNVAPRFLELVAEQTGGHYQPVATNSVLIDTFRTLIWQLKGTWTKVVTIPPRSPANTEVDAMSGISDLGVLYYADLGIAPDRPRNYVAVAPGDGLTFTREDAAQGVLQGPGEGFQSRESGYDYLFMKKNPGLETVSTRWQPADMTRQVIYAKRTDKPLFEAARFRDDATSRYRKLPILVTMDTTLGFTPSQFRVEVMVKQGDANDPNANLLPEKVPLTFDPGKRNGFYVELDLTGLKTTESEYDSYTIVVTASGKSDGPAHSLSDYSLTLPPVDLRVDNRLRLQEVEPQQLSNDGAASRSVPLVLEGRGAGAIAELPLKITIKTQPLDYQGNPRAGLLKPFDTRVVLKPQDNTLAGSLQLKLADSIPLGLYKGGELEVSAVDPAMKLAPATIPFEVAISTRKVKFSRNPVVLDYNEGKEVVSDPIRVVVSGDPLAANAPAFTVSIPPNTGFGGDELWLKASGKPQTQTIVLAKSDEPFQIGFKPKPNHVTGYFPFALGVAVNAPGFEYDPADGRVDLNFRAPRIVAPPRSVRVQRGKPTVVDLMVGLKGQPTSPVQVGVRFANPANPRFVHEGDDASSPMLDLQILDDLEITASTNAEPQPLKARILAATDMPCGTYSLENAELGADRTEPVPLRLEVIVDDLVMTDSRDVPFEATDLFFFQLKGKPLTRTFRVFAETRDLAPEEIEVVQESPFLNVRTGVENPRLRLLSTRNEPCKRRIDGRDQVGVQITLEFPETQPSFEPYSGKIIVTCKPLELSKTLQCAVQSVELVRNRDEPPAEAPR